MENKNISPAVSIIIPMYNVEKYVAELLDSILAQTFKNFEVILVDNGSTDKSHAIAESYIPKFAENIQGGELGYKIITLEENSGNAAKPRNVGIKIARGEYVWLVDSDDVISPTALEELYPLAKKYNVDVVHCDRHYQFKGETLNGAKLVIAGSERKASVVENPIFRFSTGRFSGMPWKYLIRRELITKNNLEVPNMRFGEDASFNMVVLFFSKNLLFVPNTIYYWRKDIHGSASYTSTTIQLLKLWTKVPIDFTKYFGEFLNQYEFFKEHPEVKWGLITRFFIGSIGYFLATPEYKKISMQERENILREHLMSLEDKTDLAVFLFNKLIDVRAETIEVSKKNEELQIFSEDYHKLQIENQELKLKSQSTSEITSKVLEKIGVKSYLTPFLFQKAVELKTELLKKNLEIKKLQDELQELKNSK